MKVLSAVYTLEIVAILVSCVKMMHTQSATCKPSCQELCTPDCDFNCCIPTKCPADCPQSCYPDCSHDCCSNPSVSRTQLRPLPQTPITQAQLPIASWSQTSLSQTPSRPQCPGRCSSRCSPTCSYACCLATRAKQFITGSQRSLSQERNCREYCSLYCHSDCEPTCCGSGSYLHQSLDVIVLIPRPPPKCPASCPTTCYPQCTSTCCTNKWQVPFRK